MRISTGGEASFAMDIALKLYDEIGVYYEPHSTGFVRKDVPFEHVKVIYKHFKNSPIYVDGKPIKSYFEEGENG
jgi:hypothetical protein